ncbi:MAG: hypothetical protein R3F41_12515 [Gammaproteobacteria bacterium]|nr:hypothetical protein [Pseudomonadales bacterium]MCP5348921.1 hypothetical protein [Pseudomonadales bacterium]
MKRLNRIIRIATTLTMGVLATYGTAFAQAGSNALTNARGSRIVGVWDVTVDLYNCDTGDYISSFPAMHKFELGGTGQVVPGNSPAVPVHMMVWEYLGGNSYSSVFKFFRYNPGGQLIGTTVLTNEVWVSEDGAEYHGSGISELYDLNGNRVFVAGCPSVSGTRFTAAP